MLCTQGNLASTYYKLGNLEKALSMERDVYSATLRLYGEEHENTLLDTNNYAVSLLKVKRFKEARSLLRKSIPVARRVLGESQELTLRMRWNYGAALYLNPGATLDHLREAVTTLGETERAARRVLGGPHPLTVDIEGELRDARAALRAREASPGSQ